MRKSYEDSLKALLADIQLANTLASDFQKDNNGAYLHMKMSYTPAANLFLFLAKWTDCSFAGALGLLRILIRKGRVDGRSIKSICEKKASIREFYAVIFPSLIQLQRGITDMEDRKQRELCIERYRKRVDDERKKISDLDAEREQECGICLELNSKIVLPNCCHEMCFKCFIDWSLRQRSCPFCRENLARVNPADLWVYTDDRDVVDMVSVTRDNLKRLYMYLDRLPSIGPSTNKAVFNLEDSFVKSSSIQKVISSANMD